MAEEMSELLTPATIRDIIRRRDKGEWDSDSEMLTYALESQARKLLKHRSRPELREKILVIMRENSDWYKLKDERFEETAAQLLLLYPDEEAMRQDERERIKLAVIEAGTVVDHPTKSKRSLLILLGEFFKALKKGA